MHETSQEYKLMKFSQNLFLITHLALIRIEKNKNLMSILFSQNPLKLASDIVRSEIDEVDPRYSDNIRALLVAMLNKVNWKTSSMLHFRCPLQLHCRWNWFNSIATDILF